MLPGIVVNHKRGIKAYLDGKIKKVLKSSFSCNWINLINY